ncbi:MAG: trigger factor [Chlorobiota bacterium]
MEKEIKKIDECKRELTISLTTEELQPHYEKAYKDMQPKVNLEGFRKGKVPIKMIKKMYGPGIEADTDQNLVNDLFRNYTQEENVQVLGSPVLKDIDKTEEKITYVVEFETLPTITLNDYKGIPIDEPVHTVTDEEVEEELEYILAQNGELEEAEQVTDEQHVIKVEMAEILSDDGKELSEPNETEVYLADKNILPELKEELLNTKVGDSFDYTPTAEDANPAIKDKNFKVTVKNIKKLTPAELNDEFVEKITNGRITKADELKDEINFNLQDEWDKKTRELVETQIVNNLVDTNDIPAPEQLVNQVVGQMLQDVKQRFEKNPEIAGKDDDTLKEELRPNAERSVKWELARNQIIENEGIELEDYDIDPIVEKEAKRYGQDPEQMKQILAQNPNFLTKILSKKVLDFVLDFAIINEVDYETHEKIED